MAADRERQNEYQRRYYRKNKAAFLERNRATKARIRSFLQEAKDKPCTDCRERYPYYVMDFDHREGTEKRFDPSHLPNLNSWTKMRDELAKCDLVCANCHRVRTHARKSAKIVPKTKGATEAAP